MVRTLIREMDTKSFIDKCAEEFLKMKEMQMPENFIYSKTGPHKKYSPSNPNWWYISAASLLRRVYLNGPVGVSRLRSYYGGRKERGHKPEKTVRSGGGSIREILQQLETVGFVEKNKGKKPGRIISQKGDNFVKKIVSEANK